MPRNDEEKLNRRRITKTKHNNKSKPFAKEFEFCMFTFQTKCFRRHIAEHF